MFSNNNFRKWGKIVSLEKIDPFTTESLAVLSLKAKPVVTLVLPNVGAHIQNPIELWDLISNKIAKSKT